MITLLFISLAAIFNAFMDSTRTSIFLTQSSEDLPQRFWYKREELEYGKENIQMEV
jgi:hypothetical protein